MSDRGFYFDALRCVPTVTGPSIIEAASLLEISFPADKLARNSEPADRQGDPLLDVGTVRDPHQMGENQSSNCGGGILPPSPARAACSSVRSSLIFLLPEIPASTGWIWARLQILARVRTRVFAEIKTFRNLA